MVGLKHQPACRGKPLFQLPEQFVYSFRDFMEETVGGAAEDPPGTVSRQRGGVGHEVPPPEDVLNHDLQAVRKAESFGGCHNLPCRRPMAFDAESGAGTSTESLECHGAGTGEEIQHPDTGVGTAEEVENGFTRTVFHRTRARLELEFQSSTAVFSADDSNFMTNRSLRPGMAVMWSTSSHGRL